MHVRENIQNGFWFSLGFGVAIVLLTTGCFYLTEAGLNLLNPKQEKGETQMEQKKKKPTIEELEKAIGTSKEFDILPDGSVRYKHATVVGLDDFKEDCFALRAQIEETKRQTMLVFTEHPVFNIAHTAAGVNRIEDHGEMKANLKLAFRHLEDARMRLGKAIQAYDGGKSCYAR